MVTQEKRRERVEKFFDAYMEKSEVLNIGIHEATETQKIAGNGTLYFPPFLSQYYRTDVHETTYRCRATNEAGTILSRNVRVQAGKVKKMY
uniref:Ig-like domain-containing protein n=1 Tax=Glossina palpalis gambiensis TaxID=67801 RepID=A0A1B0BV91_9MUSC